MQGQSRRRQLAEFLRSRRSRLSPEDVGLVQGFRRRTTGLRLEPAERSLLYALAGQPEPELPEPRNDPPPILRTLVQTLEPQPSYVIDRAWNVVAYNRAEAGLECEFDALPPGRRNIIWTTFTDKGARALRTDGENEARLLLAQLRSAVAERPDDSRLTELVAALNERSEECRRWWDRYEVARFVPARKLIAHPVVGDLTLDYVKLRIVDDASHTLVTYTPADTATAEALPRLVELTDGG